MPVWTKSNQYRQTETYIAIINRAHHLRKYSSVSSEYFSGEVAKGICEQSHRSRFFLFARKI